MAENICMHSISRLLWENPHDAKEAYIDFASENEVDDEDLSGLREFFENHNLIVCTACGNTIE